MKMVEMFKERMMKKILLSLLLSFNIIGFAQTNKIIDNNLGLKVSVTGASLCMIGASMKSTAVKQYTPIHGYNFTSVGISPSQRKTQLSALLVGGIITITGIIIQNLKNKKNEKNINTIISSK